MHIHITLRLCLVAVKRFPENTYFPEMLISGKGKYFSMFGCISKKFSENIFWCLEKGKCFHGVWLHFKKFSGKYFLVFGKEEGKHKSENAE